LRAVPPAVAQVQLQASNPVSGELQRVIASRSKRLLKRRSGERTSFFYGPTLFGAGNAPS